MNSKLEDFLKMEDVNARLSAGNSWLVWDSIGKQWVVFHARYHAKSPTTLYQGENLGEALEALKS